jgi:signal transduction histidine kinase
VRPVDDTRGTHTRRLRRSNALLPGVLAVIGAVEIVAGGHHPLILALGSYWVAAGILCARRVAPLAMAPAVGLVYAVTPAVGFDVSDSAAWILLLASACLSTGLHAPRARWLPGLASVLGALAITAAGLAWFTDLDPNFLFGAIFSVGPWALGVAHRGALERNHRLGAEVERARIERALAAERAAAAERDRISTELHDALAHALGAMVIQASVASDLVRRDPGAAAPALHALAQAGRDALGETGRLLRLLRDDRDELGLRLAATATEPDAPATPTGAVAAVGRIETRDLLLPVLFAVVSTVEIAWEGYGPLWAAIGAYWLAAGALCARRMLPLAMPIAVPGILVGAGLLGVETYEPGASILILALASFSVGLHVPRSRAPAGLASVLTGLVLIAVDAAKQGDLSDVVLTLGYIAPWAVGLAAREALERARELAAEAERARVEQQLEAERGAATERKRVARELHDVLANSLSVMIVQASLAADLVHGDPPSAQSAIDEVERSGRTALGDIGQLLRLIRAGADGAGTEPQHGVADLPALADEYARAGLAVDLQVDEAISRLPMGVELSAYRIVQEALTNALKHAPGSPVRVTLGRQGPKFAIEVRNKRAAAAAVAAVPSGYGLVGLRERVSLFGGELDAGPTPDGGFMLVATLPVDGEAA